MIFADNFLEIHGPFFFELSVFVEYLHSTLLTNNYALKLEHICYMGDQTCKKSPLAIFPS